MKNLLILGAGTAGTIMANKMSRVLDSRQWKITIVDRHTTHYYQPGFLFIPFGVYTPKDVVKEKAKFIPRDCSFILKGIDRIDRGKNAVIFEDGGSLGYDILIIATGAKTAPDEVEGLTGRDWRTRAFDFYTIEGATALCDALRNFTGGKLVVHLAEMPIKCPVAPLEFSFLVDWWLTRQGIRDKVELSYVTPLPGAFTKQTCSNVLGYLLKKKSINLVTDFAIERVDAENHRLVCYDERTVDYDLLVTVPTNKGDDLIERSGMGDELNFVPTDRNTLQSRAGANIFVIGDASDVPASKAGSVAHFEAEVLTHNIVNFIKGKPLAADFDGHANCFIESGFSKAFLIDFDYEIEPVQGTFPLPAVGPFSLLKETRINHWGKLAFKWLYWNFIVKGIPMPGISAKMSRMGKKIN